MAYDDIPQGEMDDLELFAKALHRIDKFIEVPTQGYRQTYMLHAAHPAEEWEQVPIGRREQYLERARVIQAAGYVLIPRTWVEE